MSDTPLYALVGMKHRGAEVFVATLPHDEPVTLVREPTNQFDSRAVQVWARGRHISYIAAKQNRALAAYMDSQGSPPPDPATGLDGFSLAGRLHRKNQGSYPLIAVVEQG